MLVEKLPFIARFYGSRDGKKIPLENGEDTDKIVKEPQNFRLCCVQNNKKRKQSVVLRLLYHQYYAAGSFKKAEFYGQKNYDGGTAALRDGLYNLYEN